MPIRNGENTDRSRREIYSPLPHPSSHWPRRNSNLQPPQTASESSLLLWEYGDDCAFPWPQRTSFSGYSDADFLSVCLSLSHWLSLMDTDKRHRVSEWVSECVRVLPPLLVLQLVHSEFWNFSETGSDPNRTTGQDQKLSYHISVSVQSLSRVRLFATPWITARQTSLSITNSQSLLKPMSIESVMTSSHLILCHPLLLPPIFPSIRVFSNESALRIRWPKHWSFSFSISPCNEYPGLISSRMDWLDLLAVQGTLNSLLQHHSSKASILQGSAFFTVQLSHPYMTTGKTIALTRRTFVDKGMSLFFNMLSRLVITFLPRSKHLLISWLQSPSAVILEPPKNKSTTWKTVKFNHQSHDLQTETNRKRTTDLNMFVW